MEKVRENSFSFSQYFLLVSVSRSDDENLFAWRLYDRLQNQTYLFAHRTPLDKIQMMDALEYERAYVEENLSKGSEIPLHPQLTTIKTQQSLTDQSSASFPSITRQSTKEKHLFIFRTLFLFRSIDFRYSSHEYLPLQSSIILTNNRY